MIYYWKHSSELFFPGVQLIQTAKHRIDSLVLNMSFLQKYFYE